MRSLPTSALKSADAFKRAMVKVANERVKSGQPVSSAELKEIIDSFDVVVGVWHEPDASLGVSIRVIKGEALIHQVRDSDRAVTGVNITAVPCRSLEEAEAIRRAFGDITRQH